MRSVRISIELLFHLWPFLVFISQCRLFSIKVARRVLPMVLISTGLCQTHSLAFFFVDKSRINECWTPKGTDYRAQALILLFLLLMDYSFSFLNFNVWFSDHLQLTSKTFFSSTECNIKLQTSSYSRFSTNDTYSNHLSHYIDISIYYSSITSNSNTFSSKKF